jgi:hypothetical protein
MTDSVSSQIGKLAKRVAALKDTAMKVAYVRHTLQKMDVALVADLLTVTQASAESNDPAHRQLMLSISMALSDESCEKLRNAVADVLDTRDQGELAHMLRPAPEEKDEEAQRVPVFGLGRPLTLGERKSLARRNDRNLIARVLRDPHPSVIRILLENPTLTEGDVVRLCSRRPTAPEIQREVFKHRRWIVRYKVKMAIVLNPYTPLNVALQIVPHLNAQDLRRVAASQDLAERLRRSCSRRKAGSTTH